MFFTVGFTDEKRHKTDETIKQLRDASLHTRVLSGDHKMTVIKFGLALDMID
jgi:magnesium-transporting ATPase (P-type)